MLRQILKDMYIDPELLAELSDEQKQVLFIKMREEQVRRCEELEAELVKAENATSVPKKKSRNKKSTNVHYLMAKDGNPWVWVLGESDEDALEDEKQKNLEALEDKETERKAKEIAEKEAVELRIKELAAIELRAKKLKLEQEKIKLEQEKIKLEQEKIEKDRAEKERSLNEKKRQIEQTNQQGFKKNLHVIKLDENELRDLKNKENEKREKEKADRRLAEMRERKRKEEEERKAIERIENERKHKEAEKKRNEELRKKKEHDEQENKRRELVRKEAEEKRIQEMSKQKKEEERRLQQLKNLEVKEDEEKRAKERELKEKQEQRTREIYERIKKQKLEERRREDELSKKDHEAWIEREKRAKEAEFQRRSSVSEARKEVKRREEEVKELQKQGFIEVASGLYRRFSQSKSKVHRVDIKQSESMKKHRPIISSPALISATHGSTIPVRAIKPQKPERSPPSIPRRPSSRLGPAPPPPVKNGDAVVQKRTDRPNNRQQIIEWWQEIELAKGSGFENNVAYIWFHGIITRQEAECLLEEKPVGSFLVRVSERVWGYTISYRSVDRCKHFLIDTSDHSYQFFGHNQIAHASLADLVKFHQSKSISGIGRELLLKPCGQKEGSDPDYKELVSQTTVI